MNAKPNIRVARVVFVVTGAELAALDALTARRAAAQPGYSVSRSAVVREAICKMAEAEADAARAA